MASKYTKKYLVTVLIPHEYPGWTRMELTYEWDSKKNLDTGSEELIENSVFL